MDDSSHQEQLVGTPDMQVGKCKEKYLRCFAVLAYLPTLDFICSCREEVYQLNGSEACRDNLVYRALCASLQTCVTITGFAEELADSADHTGKNKFSKLHCQMIVLGRSKDNQTQP